MKNRLLISICVHGIHGWKLFKSKFQGYIMYMATIVTVIYEVTISSSALFFTAIQQIHFLFILEKKIL